MRKISLIGFVMLIVSIPTFAGGLLTNTNQHVAFLRMLARGASIDIDGSNIPKPSSKEAFPPPPPTAKLPDTVQSPFL